MKNKFDRTKFMKYSAGIFLFFIIIIIIFLRSESESDGRNSNLSILPKFEALDIYGKLVNSSYFEGKCTYIQFIDPKKNDDIELLKEIYSKWKGTDLELVAITKDLEQFKLKTHFINDNITIFDDRDGELVNKFNSSYLQSSFYLFDENGKRVTSKLNNLGYESEIRYHLNSLIFNKEFSISTFIPIKKNIHQLKWFNTISDYILSHNNNFYIIALFNYFCTNCASGQVLENLKVISSFEEDVSEIAILVSHDYSELDIINFVDQLKINFSVLRADDELNEKWNHLGNEFLHSLLNNIVFVIDKNGVILEVAYPNCNCYEDFFRFTKSLFRRIKRDQ